MIFKLTLPDRKEFAQAKSQLHLLQECSREYDDFLDIQEVVEISEEESKTIMLKDNQNNSDITLFDLACSEDFVIVGSTDWD